MSYGRQMKRNVGVAAAALMVTALGCITAPAQAAYEGFETYSPGSNLNGLSGGAGWTSAWASTGSSVAIESVMLDDPAANVDGGAQAAHIQPAANVTDTSGFISRTFGAMTGDVYLGLLIRVSSFDDGDFLQIQLSDGAIGNDSNTLSVGIQQASGNPFFARVGTSGNSSVNSSTQAADDTDFLLVAKFSKDGSGQYAHTDLYINPTDPFHEPLVANASASSSAPSITQLTRLSARLFSIETDDVIRLDEIRISSNFSGALGIPEPASIGLLGAGMLMLMRRRRA